MFILTFCVIVAKYCKYFDKIWHHYKKKKTLEHLGIKISILKIVKTLQNLCIDPHIDLHTIDVI